MKVNNGLFELIQGSNWKVQCPLALGFSTTRVKYLWICLNLKIVGTKVAFHPELVYWGSVVHARLGLLSIITYSHSNMTVATTTPDVVRHLKPEVRNILIKTWVKV